MNVTHWVAGRWSRKTFGAASAASGGRVAARVPCCSPAHCDCSQRLCALDVLVAACEAIRGSPSHTSFLPQLHAIRHNDQRTLTSRAAGSPSWALLASSLLLSSLTLAAPPSRNPPPPPAVPPNSLRHRLLHLQQQHLPPHPPFLKLAWIHTFYLLIPSLPLSRLHPPSSQLAAIFGANKPL